MPKTHRSTNGSSRSSVRSLALLIAGSALIVGYSVIDAGLTRAGYRDLARKHEATMRALDVVSEKLKQYQYELRKEAFDDAINWASTPALRIEADNKRREFMRRFPDAESYDVYLRSLRKGNG